MLSNLRPETSVTVGLATGAACFGIYSQMLPGQTDVRVNTPHDPDIESSRKKAAMLSAGLVVLVFAISKDFNAFIIGGAALVGIDATYKHANAVHPATGKVATDGGGMSIAPGLAVAYPSPDYTVEDLTA